MIDQLPPRSPEAIPVEASDSTGTIQRRARGFLALFFVAIGLYTLKSFLPALLWGCVFAISLWPLYQRAERRFGRSDWLPMIFTLVVALIFLVPVSLVGVKLADEIRSALEWIDDVRNNGIPMPEWVPHLPFIASQATTWWQNHMTSPQRLSHLLHSVDVGHGMQMTKQVGSQVARRGTLFAFSLLTLFFLLKDGDYVIRKGLVGSHRLFGAQGESLAKQMISSVHGTLAGLVLVGLGEGAIMGMAYMLTGAPQPLLFAMLTAVAAMIPFLAWPTVGLVALLLLAKSSMIGAIVVMALGSVVIFVADHFVRPVLIGGSTKMPFLWVLLGILGGAETWGLLGLFLGPAIMAALHLLWTLWTEERTDGKKAS
ncbi:transporter [Gluconobacter thailandicus F149-1 = NBRC 100600]|uniref:Permease n=1 Tax=Gluconobacter thailandicus NBRC 3257 TaxID=1381097 RepID=A0ABQ0ISF3_GLUTH|nr:AI-2E family transporter [Gluconobacter thailandicus]AFW01966.1 permease [Gluconobacter oxydans H24]ANQ42458.1 AI-2E family transporter [Gluconobacter oxydans]KXV53322.1 transporter [Gluconobacter thailandicus]GAC86959.1 permease [Gluconobacter thailandicus NBRC 3255]GAD25150.1 permease [Gluconobacter thailandicus NBRC 3257]